MTEMNRDCPRLDSLAGWVEGTLSPEERAAVEGHLSGCDTCRRSVVLATGLEAPAGGEVDEVLLGRVVRMARRRPLWSWAAAAALLVALGLGFALAPSEAPVEEPPAAPLVVESSVKPADPVAVAPEPDPEPVPAPAVEPAPIRPATPPRPTRSSVAHKGDFRETPPQRVKPAPRHEPPKVPEIVKKPDRPTRVNLDAIFTPVFIVDPTATLRLSRDGGDPAAVSRYEQVTRHDLFTAPLQGAAFTLEAKASVVLEKGSELKVSYFKPDQAFAAEPTKGLIMIDTEGQTQRWRFTLNGTAMRFHDVNGQLAVEPRDGRLVAVLLSGEARVTVNGEKKRAAVGREVVLFRDGAAEKDLLKRGDLLNRLRRLARLRPKVSTAFAATFDEKGKVRPFPYALIAGRVVEERDGLYLHGQVDEEASQPGRTICMAALKPAHPFEATSGMVLRFRYRTTARKNIRIHLGKYTAVFETRPRRSWTPGEIPLSRFEHEGVMMVPSDRIGEVRFEAAFENKAGVLHVDAVQFLRRAR